MLLDCTDVKGTLEYICFSYQMKLLAFNALSILPFKKRKQKERKRERKEENRKRERKRRKENGKKDRKKERKKITFSKK